MFGDKEVLMSIRLFVVVGLLLAAGLTGEVLAQGTLTASPPTCLPAGRNGVVSATLAPETGWASVRLYFRKAGEADAYFLEMRSEGEGSYWAAVPQSAAGTSDVELRVVARSAEGAELAADPVVVPVFGDCIANLTPAQADYAGNLVVGETAPAQASAAVIGFECDGIVSRLGADGSLRSDEFCRDVMMASAAAEAGVAGGTSGVLLPAAIGAAVVAGAVIISDDDDEPETSPARPE
jgi:hypothetical protein